MTVIVADDGVTLSYVEHGDPSGPSVVLLAGFKAPATSWRYQIPPLVSAGYRVIAVDLRGHGDADHPDSGIDMARRGQDVRDVLDTLDLRDVLIIGGSMGGNTIWSYVSQFGVDRLAGIVVVDQTPKMMNTSDWANGFYGYNESNADTFFTGGIPRTDHGTPLWRRGMRLVRLLRAMKGADPRLSPEELSLLGDHARADWRAVIARTSTPVLFMAGEHSEYWPAAHAHASAGITSHGESVVIRNTGHAANIEQPGTANAAILDFASALRQQ